jgi:molybdopterin converting factor small subunit
VRVRVRYYVLFWLHAGRRREEAVHLLRGATLSHLFGALCERHGPSFTERLVKEGRFHPLCWCLLNGRRLTESELDLPLHDGDEVVLTTPLVVGG